MLIFYYERGVTKEYKNALPVSSVTYSFKLSGDAKTKRESVARILADGIAAAYGTTATGSGSEYVIEKTGAAPRTKVNVAGETMSVEVAF